MNLILDYNDHIFDLWHHGVMPYLLVRDRITNFEYPERIQIDKIRLVVGKTKI